MGNTECGLQGRYPFMGNTECGLRAPQLKNKHYKKIPNYIKKRILQNRRKTTTVSMPIFGGC